MTTAATATGRVRDYLSDRTNDMVCLLQALANAESPSHDPAAQRIVFRLLTDALNDAGMRVRHRRGITTGGYLLAVPQSRRRGSPLQLLLGHCDTVWPIGTVRSMPVEQRDGKLFGPGVYDMKAGLVQVIFALSALRSLSLAPEVTPVMLINSDEEIGSPESTPGIIRLAQRADRAFVAEPSLGASGSLKTARKGVGRFTVRVSGRAAHAGLDPEQGASAILELTHVVQSLFALNDPERGVTVNVGTIDGGMRPNVVAAEATAEADVRVLTAADARRIEAAIHGLKPVVPGTRLQIIGRIGREPLEKNPANQQLWEAACDIADELNLELSEATAGGGSDGNTTSRFTATLDGLGAVGGGAHATHEHVEVDRLAERTALLAGLLLLPPLPVPDLAGRSG